MTRVPTGIPVNIADSIPFYFNFGKGHYFVLRVKQHIFGKAQRSSTKRSELQRIRERRGGKPCPIWVFSYAKTQKKIRTFFLPIVV